MLIAVLNSCSLSGGIGRSTAIPKNLFPSVGVDPRIDLGCHRFPQRDSGLFQVVIEFVVFPPNLMSNWPSLEEPTVGVVDLVRTGAFISTVGVLSGALAGGLEDRAIVGHLALFARRP